MNITIYYNFLLQLPQTNQFTKLEIVKVLKIITKFGGGGWTRTNDLRIMRPSL
jgi:hypothetical protein